MTAISWKTGSTDVWSDSAAWSTGTVPGASDDVTIAVAPATAGVPYTVEIESAVSVHSIALNQSAATVQVDNTTLSVGTTFALTAGTLDLVDGTLQGGTYSSTSGTVLLDGYDNIINNVVWDGTLNLDAGTNSYPTVYFNTLTLHGASGTGAGTLAIGNQVSAYANSGGSATLSNAAITLGSYSALCNEGTLTLASTTSVTETSGLGTLGGFTYSGYSLTNQGRVTASGTASTLSIVSGSFTNTGSILASGGGTVVIDSVTGSSSGLLYAGAGSFLELETTATTGFTNTGSVSVTGTLALDYGLTTAQLAAFAVPNGTVAIVGTLTNTGTTLTTGTKLGNLVLDGGTIVGGTIVNSGHFGFVGSGSYYGYPAGTLSSVTFDGPLNLTGLDEALTAQGSLTLAGSTGTGAGTLVVTGNGAGVDFTSTQVINGAVIKLGSNATTLSGVYSYLEAGLSGESAATTLVLGSATTLTQAGANAELTTATVNDAFLNQGTITAASSGGTLAISVFTNAGTLNDTNETLYVLYSGNGSTLTNTGTLSLSGSLAALNYSYNSSTLTNSGLLSISNGATVALGNGLAFTNTGTLAVSAALATLYGTLSTASLGTIKVTSGGTLGIAGQLTNTGTLSLGSTGTISTLALDSGGSIIGGTIKDAGGGLVGNFGGTLSGVTYEGDLSLAGSFSNLTVTGGLTTEGATGTGAGTIAVTGTGAEVIFAGSQTLNNVKVSLGSAPTANGNYYNDIIAGSYSETAATTLTLGATFQLNQVGEAVELEGYSANDEIVNEGTITAGYAYGQLNATGLVNQGTILVSNNDQVEGLASNSGTINVTAGELRVLGTFTNAGLLSLSGTAAYLGTYDLGENYAIDNTGTLSVASGATLDLGAGPNSFSNTGVLKISDATAVLAGTLSAASLGTVTLSSGGVLDLEGTLTNAGTLAIGTGTALSALTLQYDGDISGGTITDAGGGIVADGGTLSAVTYKGVLSLEAQNASLTIAGGLTMQPTTGSGVGTVSLGGYEAQLVAAGSQTISNAVIDMDGVASTAPATLFISDLNSTPSTLTLASTTSLVQTADAYVDGTSTNDVLVNNGTLSFGASYGFLVASDLTLKNSAALNITNGENLEIVNATLTNSGTLSISGSYSSLTTYAPDEDTDGFTNTGLVTIGATDTLTLDGSAFYNESLPGVVAWSNSGTIDVAGGLLNLGDTFTTAQLGSIVVSNGGTVQFTPDAYLNNTGGTLTVGIGTAIGTIAMAGTIHGGIIVDEGGGIAFDPYAVSFYDSTYGTLDAVTYRGTLTVGAYDTATITGGLTLQGISGTGAGSVVLNNTGSILDFATTETLNNAYLYFGASGGGNTLSAASASGTTTLTLGTNIRLTQTGAAFTLGGYDGTIVNTASLGFAEAGGTLTLAGTFTNSGTIAVSNGETLVLATSTLQNTGKISVTNGLLAVGNATSAQLAAITLSNSDLAVTGTLTSTGATLTVGTGTSIPVLKLQGTVFGGTIHDAGGGVQFGGFSTLDNVTYQGTMTVGRPLSTVFVEGSFAATSVTGSLPGSLSLTGAGSALVWDTTQALNNATLSIGNPGLSYEGNAVPAPALVADENGNIPVTLGASLTIQQSGTYADIGGEGGYGYLESGAGTVQSAATLDAAISGGNLALEGYSFASTGTIAISNSDTVTAGAATTTNAGLISIGTGSALNLNLYNYFADASLADESFINTGSIALAGGSIVELTDGGTFPSVNVLNAAGANIKGFGSVAAPIANNGIIEASGGTLSLTQAVSGTGTLQVDAGAVLNLTSVSSGETATFSGVGGILGLAPPSFLGVIGGFAVGDTLDLASTAAKSATFSGKSIVVTLTAGGTLTLATTSALSGTLSVTAGTHGDSLLKYSSAAVHGPAAPFLPIVPDAASESTVAQINTDASTQNTDWVPVLHL